MSRNNQNNRSKVLTDAEIEELLQNSDVSADSDESELEESDEDNVNNTDGKFQLSVNVRIFENYFLLVHMIEI